MSQANYSGAPCQPQEVVLDSVGATCDYRREPIPAYARDDTRLLEAKFEEDGDL